MTNNITPINPFHKAYKMAEQDARDAIRVTECGNGHRGVGFHSAQLDEIVAEWSPLTVDELEATARRMLDLAAKMRAGIL